MSLNKKTFTKEMLQNLLKEKLNQRLIKLEEKTKDQISSLNYTSKYFKEFSKAIQQFSKFFEESEEIKEKEKELTEKKENIKENYNTIKYIQKKSNESGGSSNLTKNSNKTKQYNKKIENPLRIRSNTQGLFKSQQLKKQATNLVLAKNIFSNKNIEEKKQNKTKQNLIISPDKEKNFKSSYILREGGKNDTPVKIQKNSLLLERNAVQLKMPKTEKRTKNTNKKKKIKDNNNKINNKSHNISENKTENNTEKENINNITKYSTSLKKSLNSNNSKNDIKNKKEIKFNLKDKMKNVDSIEDFSKTLNNNRYINKTIDLDDADKINVLKSSFSTKKKRKLKLNNGSENINDIKDIVKLVDNVHQNITKLLETNERLNNNKSVMISSLEISNANKTFVETNNRSSTNILDNSDDDDLLNNKKNKIFSLKKKINNPNIGLFKDNDENNNDDAKYNLTEVPHKSDIVTPLEKEFDKFLNKNKSSKANNRYQEEFNSKFVDIDKVKDKENNEKEIINIKNIDVMDIFKKEKKILKNILKYLKDKEIILFTSSNNYLNKERISFLDNKKEELLQILNLQKDETMETKIKKIKNEFSEEILSNPPIKFSISEETNNKIKELNKDENIQIFKNDLDIKNKNTNLLIKIYKILFILIDKEYIYSILNENKFWKKCCEYLINNSKGKIGDFIIEKISSFIFDVKTFNNIENIIKENKENFIKELKEDKKYFISKLIEEALVYCGVIFEPTKTQGNIIIKNLKNNQTVINYLNNLKVRYFLAKYEEDDDD